MLFSWADQGTELKEQTWPYQEGVLSPRVLPFRSEIQDKNSMPGSVCKHLQLNSPSDVGRCDSSGYLPGLRIGSSGP